MTQFIETGKFSPAITNMGIISPLPFGQIPAYDAYLVPPTIKVPGFLLGAGAYEPSHRTEDVDALMHYPAMRMPGNNGRNTFK
ncbi:MAG: hypothetical protein WA125_00170 [Desulfosporosinus sp.]